jgi:hypothetical protein
MDFSRNQEIKRIELIEYYQKKAQQELFKRKNEKLSH